MWEMRLAMSLLAGRPEIGHVREDLTERAVKFWPIYSYLIVCNPATHPIQILRVLHGMRDVERFSANGANPIRASDGGC
jgi:antitoxin ParD1/3/4/toxin ParE1/3/4